MDFKSIERRFAKAAGPENAPWRIGIANRTGNFFAARHGFDPSQSPCGFESSETLYSGKRRDYAQPGRPDRKGKQSQTGDANESNDDGGHQAPCPSQEIPKQRVQYPSAIEWINRQNIKDEQPDIDHIQARHES